MILRTKNLIQNLGQDLETDKILNIKGIKLPNFYLLSPFKWEFCHQLIELYEDYVVKDGNFLYENQDVAINKNDIVYDCGANMGLFSAYAASKGAKVYAFEPNSKMLPYLEMVRFFYPAITIIPKAIYSESNIKMPYYQYDNPGSNHIVGERSKLLNYFSIIEVDTIALDDFSFSPTYIKMDIEGSEKNALIGAINILQTMKPKLAIAAYHFQDDLDVLPQAILSCNSNYTYKVEKNVIFAV